MYSAILIAGPTASGKSALAMRLAEQIGGRVVNADSMQVYADLRVLTARPTRAEEARVPHRLFGHVDGAVNYSVGKWLADAGRELEAARADGATPVFAGGTGMYFKALTQGLSDIPPVPDEVRARVRAAAEGVAPDVLHARLAAGDPASAARLRPSDPQRILRALEVLAATGKSLTDFQGARRAPLLDASQCLCLFLAPERAALNARIDARFEAMMDEGALDEVSRLAARGLDPALPIMRAHGAPGLMAYLRGEVALDEAIARGQRDTRAYAKRQFTFARHQLPAFRWIGLDEAREFSI
jgi:tRNA dimethylallyltransferase